MRLTGWAMAAAIAAGCLVPSAASAKTLAFCAEARPEGFDPARYVAPTTLDATRLVYDRLVEFDQVSGSVSPSLAASWEVSPDGLVYTFHLRTGVQFQKTPWFTPTRNLNADDVLFSFMRQRDPRNDWFSYAGGYWPHYASLAMDQLVKTIRKVDDETVQFELVEPDAAFLSTLALDFASILSAEYAATLVKAETPERLDTHPVGTGVYWPMLQAGARTNFREHPDHWRGAPGADYFAYLEFTDPAARLAALKEGRCHIAADPGADVLAAPGARDGIEIAETPRMDVAFLAFNTTQPPFDDARVRKALSMAIDRRAIVSSVHGGAAVAATGLLPPVMAGYDKNAADAPYDAEAAKALLEEAGVRDLTLRILTTATPRPYNPDPVRTAGMIADDLAKVGVTVKVVEAESLGVFLRQSVAEDRDGAVLFGWTSDAGDPGAYLSILASCDAVGASNRAQWCSAPFDEAIAKAAAATGFLARTEAIAEAQAILVEEQPITAIAHSIVRVAQSPKVTGFSADPLGRHVFHGVDVLP